MTNFSWSIAALNCSVEKDGLPKVIHTIHWRYGATKVVGDKTYFVDTYGAQGVAQPNPENFIPYEDITEAEIVSWLESVISMDAMQASLEAKIEEQINPKEVTLPLPWASAPVLSIEEPVLVVEEPVLIENNDVISE